MGARRQAREAALQILYLMDVGGYGIEDAAKTYWVDSELPPRSRTFADELAAGASAQKARLDAFIMKYAENWELSRMAAVDRNILRVAAYELLFHTDTPVSVVIDEAVEIAKTFSTQDSGKFVNGILDKIKLERASVTVTEAGEPTKGPESGSSQAEPPSSGTDVTESGL